LLVFQIVTAQKGDEANRQQQQNKGGGEQAPDEES
jgi:hypothetical protein